MEWGRIVVPVSGGPQDAALVARAAAVAGPLSAELHALYAPTDPALLSAWLSEGYPAGIPATAVQALRAAGQEGEHAARAAFEAEAYARKRFTALKPPAWRAMALECRLADLVVFDPESARGHGPLAEMFELVLMEERCAVLVARDGGDVLATALVAWDGGEPACRAARRAAPLLRHAQRIVITGSPAPEANLKLQDLADYYACRGLSAEIEPLSAPGDVAAQLFAVAARLEAGLMVAGAFGRSRLRELIFGGTTRALLQGQGPSLFLAH